MNNPVILVYRRNHKGDPNEDGIFGINDCMGSVRDWEYDAVIGIGGSAPWDVREGLAYKINWIGIGPNKRSATSKDCERMRWDYPKFKEFRGKLVTFDRFLILNGNGPLVKSDAQKLHDYMFVDGRIPRAAKNFPDDIYSELLSILKLADDASPSLARTLSKKPNAVASKCPTSNCVTKTRRCK